MKRDSGDIDKFLEGYEAYRKGADEHAGLVDGKRQVGGNDYAARGDAGELSEYKAHEYAEDY